MACQNCKNKTPFQISSKLNWMLVFTSYGFVSVIYTTYKLVSHLLSLI